MAFFTQNKFNYTTGVPDGNDVYPSVSSTWGDDGAGVLGNGTIAFPTAAGGAGQVLTDVAGNGTLTFADAPSTPPSGSDTQVQYNNGGSFGGMAALTYNDSTGKIIANANASSTGDFEVLAETSGTAAFIDVSKGDLGLGTNVTNPGTFNGRWITMLDADRNGIEMRRTGSDSDGSTIGQILATAPFVSGNSGIIGAISIATDGGTSTNRGGRVVLNVKEDATSNNHQLRLTQSGLVEIDRGLTLNVDGNSSADVKIKGTSGSTIAFFDISKKGIGINTDIVNPSTFNGKWITMLDADRSGIEMKRNGSDTDLSTIGQFFGTSTQISGGSGIAGSFFIGTDGATAGNRGGRVGFSAKENGSNTFHSLIVRSTGIVEVDRGMTLNKDANGAADFEVLAETTGTALLVDVSTGDVGIGTTTVNRGDFGARALTLLGTTAGGGLIEIAKDTGDSDGAGIGGLEFNHSLASGNNGRVGLIGCNLSGSTAGNRGSKIAIRTKANGSSTYNINFTIDHDRTFDFAGGGVFNSARIDQNFDFKKTSSGTAFFIDTATTDVGIGTDTPNIAGFGRVLTIVEAADTNNARIELHKNTSDSDGAGLGSYEWTHALVSGANSRVAFVSTRLSGGTAGNRGGELDFGTKANGSSTLSTHLTIDNTGKTVLNAAALSGGDFEVLAETTGTAAFIDVSEKKFAIGTGAATNPLTVVSDANGVPILANAKGTSTTSIFLAADYLHTTTANMADNFGTGFRFQIEDVAGVVNDIASVYARRDGADNEGKLELLAGTDGAEVGLTLNSDLVIDIAQNFSQITAITDSGAVNSFERTTTDTSLIRPTFRMLSETSGNMADGFGTGMFFMIKDGGATEIISAIYAIRDGADNEGKLSFRTGVDGDVENAVLDAAGTFTLEQGVVSLKETTTPTSVADYGRIYFKSDNKAYAQTGDGVEHEIAFV